MNKKRPTLLDSLNQIHRLDCMDNLHKSCTPRIQVEFDNFVFQYHRPWHWEKETISILQIIKNHKTLRIRNQSELSEREVIEIEIKLEMTMIY